MPQQENPDCGHRDSVIGLVPPNALLVACVVAFMLPSQRGSAQERMILAPGTVITSSVVIEPGRYFLPADSTGAVVIRGDDITVDLSGVALVGAESPTAPNDYKGTGIRIESGSGIRLIGGTIRGYSVAVHATSADELEIIGGDFSYNYRQRLKSSIEREHLDDWMSYHINENDEWLRYGAAVYISESDRVVVRNVRITGGQNGVMLTRSNHALIEGNEITFNSGIGVGLYRSSNNQVVDNQLDWNVRGYSHGVYNRGQDSAALLLYEQSNENLIARNSATHSGDGLFLWAGQTTMDTGTGGCNDNVIIGNDFSFAPTNGIEVTFSRNIMIGNRIEGCWHGIWGGYSFDSEISDNTFVDNDEHIAIEHGQRILVNDNTFVGGIDGLRVWARDSQPEDWGYAKARDVRSRGFEVRNNEFLGIRRPINIVATDSVAVRDNTFDAGFDSLTFRGSERVDFGANRFAGVADISLFAGVDLRDLARNRFGEASLTAPRSQPVTSRRPPDARVDRSYILVDEWGPVDFRSPRLWPRSDRRSRTQEFEIVGPPGRWRLLSTEGVQSVSDSVGVAFDVIEVTMSDADAVDVSIRLEYVGSAVTDRFGATTPAGQPYVFEYRYSFVPITWNVSFFEYNEDQEPRTQYDAFRRLIEGDPKHAEQVDDLGYQMFRSPAPGVRPDHFATVAEATINVPAGDYVFDLTSDDGVRVWLDGEIVHDDWTYHAPKLAEIALELGGTHTIRIEHFEINGYAVLSGSLRKDTGRGGLK